MTDTSARPEAPVPPSPPPTGMPRWAKITLIVSLALNLLLVGSIAGHRLATRHGPFASVFREADDAARFARRLPAERRQALRAIFEKHRDEFRPHAEAVREARKGLEAASADPFDKVRFIAALAALQDAETKARSARRPMAAEMAAILTPEERKRFLNIHGGLQRQLVPPGERRRSPQPQQE